MFLSCKNLKKSFGKKEAKCNALNGLSLEVDRGEICIILGPSGCGKSTLLHIIGGLESPDEGSIQVDGQSINSLDKNELASYRKKDVGFVFQNYQLIPDLTIEENIEVCRLLTDNPLEKEALLETLGIADKAKRFPKELSGGQQQRAAIARALIKNPKLLLCDEPTGALDSHSAKEILSLLYKINHLYGTTILIVTHNNAITPIGNRVIKMHDGTILEQSVATSPLDPDKLENL